MEKVVMSKDTGYPPIEQVTSATIKTGRVTKMAHYNHVVSMLALRGQ